MGTSKPPKKLRLVASEALGPRGRLLELEAEPELGFTGGQFLIMETGLVKEDGAPLKRCYSMLSSDVDQRRIQVAVQRVGPGSEAMQRLEPGAELMASGPWGKLLPSAQERPGASWVVATDTGITAALGLLRGAGFAERLASTTLLWLDHGPDALLPEEFVRERLPAALGRFERRELPPVGAPERVDRALAVFADVAQPEAAAATAAWLVGDGALLFPIRDELGRRSDDALAADASVECFFNRPERVGA